MVQRLASLNRGAQRWLRAALHAISTMEPERVTPPKRTGQPRRDALDEALRSEEALRDQAEAYPELAGELLDIADIVDLLREAGEQRRRLGEQILREQMEEGAEPEEGEEEES